MEEEAREETISRLRKAVKHDSSPAKWVELSGLLDRTPEERQESREILFRVITESPENVRARLVLARLFYLDGYNEFCLRELVEIRQLVELPSLGRLLEALGDAAKEFVAERHQRSTGGETISAASPLGPTRDLESEVIAEVDIDAEFLDALEELKSADGEEENG